MRLCISSLIQNQNNHLSNALNSPKECFRLNCPSMELFYTSSIIEPLRIFRQCLDLYRLYIGSWKLNYIIITGKITRGICRTMGEFSGRYLPRVNFQVRIWYNLSFSFRFIRCISMIRVVINFEEIRSIDEFEREFCVNEESDAAAA